MTTTEGAAGFRSQYCDSLFTFTQQEERFGGGDPHNNRLSVQERGDVWDSFPSRRFEGWVGFVSSVAEFTPKPVQTEELRTKLVYEVRIFVKDPSDDLRLGMPATAHLDLNAAAVATQPASTQQAALP